MSYQIDFRHLRSFLALADTLHFHKAAERLYITQPGLSRQIKEMERQLDLQLFDRHNRKVELTAAGAYLQRELSRQLHQLERTYQQAQLLHQGIRGELRLGYVGSAMQQIIPALMIHFRERYPDVLFSLKEMDNQAQLEGLLTGQLDIGFVRQERLPAGLRVHPVLQEHFCLVLPEDHPLTTATLADYQDEAFILFTPHYSPTYYERVMELFDHSGFTPQVSHHTVHAASIYKLVQNGFGLSVVPQSLAQIPQPGIRFVNLDQLPQRTTLSAVWDPDNEQPILTNFLEVLHA